MIKKGSLIEFTDDYYQHYPPEDKSKIQYGVCIKDCAYDACLVELADGNIVHAKYIYAYAWAGWIPEGLEEVWDKYNPDVWSDY